MTTEELLAGHIICIDKPYGWTSFQVVNKVKAVVRKATGLKKFKIGHAGTLDPLATGVLIVCIGKATKEIPLLQDGEKIYSGTMVLGATTPCYDMEQAVDHVYENHHITESLVEEKRGLFMGEILQVPPMFSAVKIDGQRAYQYARKDDPSVTIEPKKVTISEFNLTNLRPSIPMPPNAELDESHTKKYPHLYDNPQGFIPEGTKQLDFYVRCGKGTYIRSLARDLGVALDSGAFLSELRRLQVGQFKIEQALRIDEVENYFLKLFNQTDVKE